MKLNLKTYLLTALTLISVTSQLSAKIKHIFLAVDESRQQLLYVDEFKPSNDWTIPLKGNRDLQIISNTKVLVSVSNGYREYEIKTGKLLKEVLVGNDIFSVVRKANGNTLLASRNSTWVLDKNDTEISTNTISAGPHFRLLRISKHGNYLFTSGETSLKQATPMGKTVKEVELTEFEKSSKKPYCMMQAESGHYLISTGYGTSVLILDKDYKLIRSINKDNAPRGTEYHFFAGIELLKNNHLVVSNWTGHNPQDSEKGPQAVEFNTKGKQVWKWHDPKRAGSLHGIAIIK